MAGSTVEEQRVSVDSLRELVADIFRRCDMAESDAEALAESLVAADLHGVHSHGVMRVPEYVKKLTVGGVNPRGQPSVVRDAGACLVVDGGNSMGQIAASFAMRLAIERAATTGIAAVAVRGSNHCGAMARYATLALPHDMIGLATTNALPTMAPWGGAERILGIDPLAIAVPAGRELPIVYDGAFSGSSHGKIRIYQQKGLTLPEGWALDRLGRPTTDPAAAIDGLLVPIGGYKGAGLAMIMGILSSMLSGAAYGTELGDIQDGAHPGQDGHFFAAIRVGAFEDVARFKERVDRAIEQIHACTLAPGFERVYAPGEMGFLLEREYRQNGIPLNAVTLRDLEQTAQALGASGF
jgi:LDH2 family malate/lactate/ureidoglycolate dehydrogenase